MKPAWLWLSGFFLFLNISEADYLEISENLIAALHPYAPKQLYKYRAPTSTSLDDIVNHATIYLASPASFNDPFDCRPYIANMKDSAVRRLYMDALKDTYPSTSRAARRRVLKSRNSTLNKEFTEDVFRKMVGALGIYCLSERFDDILMWSHYADSHKGYCLCFNYESYVSEAFKVLYSHEYPEIDLASLGVTEDVIRVLMTKSRHWEYEQEWRIIEIKEKGIAHGEHLIDRGALSGVIFGAKMDDQVLSSMVRNMQNSGMKLRMQKAELDRKRYAVNVVDL